MRTARNVPAPTRDVAFRRVAAYARVSSQNQVLEHDSSVDTQLERIRERARYESGQAKHTRRPPWQIIDEYREEGRSGKNTDRPELQRLLSDIALGKIDMVCVTKIDRITRSLTDFYLLWEIFEKHGVEFIALDDNFETNSATGRAMLKITLVFAELERERTSERTREKVQSRRQQGLWFGGHIPFGYRKDPSNATTLQVDPDAAAVLRKEFFERFLELGSARGLVRYLGQRGIKRPKATTKRGKVRGGQKFSTQNVLDILRDRRYLAERILDDGAVVACAWPAIIDRSLFDRVQAALDMNSIHPPSGRPSAKHVYLLEGLLKCGACGSTMTRTAGTGRNGAHFYYRCSKKHHSASQDCRTRDIPVGPVEKFVLDRLRHYSVNEERISSAVRAANSGRDDALAESLADLRKVTQAHVEATKKISKLLDSLENEDGPMDALKARLRERQAEEAKLRTEKYALETKKQVLERQMLDAAIVVEGLNKLVKAIGQAESRGDYEELRELLREIVDLVEWRPDPDNPKQGEAVLQLFELGNDWIPPAPKNERPSDPPVNGSLSRPEWLAKRNSNANHRPMPCQRGASGWNRERI